MFLISHKFWIFFFPLPMIFLLIPKTHLPACTSAFYLANCTVLSLIGKTASP